MSNNWPPLDTHAHIDVSINARDLLNLRAVIFAASRSLEESRRAMRRQHRDVLTVWGLGVHPGVKASLDAYDAAAFSALLDETAYVGEVGLDGKVESRLAQQREVLGSILQQLQQRPRLTSIHSYGATVEILDELERTPVTGAILHWWLGDPALTERAVNLGAYFSINASCVRRCTLIDTIPLDRLLIETIIPTATGRPTGLDNQGAQATSRKPSQARTASVLLTCALRHGRIWRPWCAQQRRVSCSHRECARSLNRPLSPI